VFVKEEWVQQVVALRGPSLLPSTSMVVISPTTKYDIREYVRQAIQLSQDKSPVPIIYLWSHGRDVIPLGVNWTQIEHTLLYDSREWIVGYAEAWQAETKPVHTTLYQLFPPPRLPTPPPIMHSLSFLMQLYGSDKGDVDDKVAHHYTHYYDELFGARRNDPSIKLFELGSNKKEILNASCHAWQDYFHQGHIYAGDIYNVPFKTLDSDRIHMCHCCELPSIDTFQQLWAQPEVRDVMFDVIIEGVYSKYFPSALFFEQSIHKLNKGGYFIIENIDRDVFDLFLNKIISWKDHYPDMSFELVNLQPSTNQWFFNQDNILLVIHRNS
jgi:hypothetical protein